MSHTQWKCQALEMSSRSKPWLRFPGWQKIALICFSLLLTPCKLFDAAYCASWDLNCDPFASLLYKTATCSVLNSTNVTTYYNPVAAPLSLAGIGFISVDSAENLRFASTTAPDVTLYRLKPDLSYDSINTPIFGDATSLIRDVLLYANSLYFTAKTVGALGAIRSTAGSEYNFTPLTDAFSLIETGGKLYAASSGGTTIKNMSPDFTTGADITITGDIANRLAPGPSGIFYYASINNHTISKYDTATSTQSVLAGVTGSSGNTNGTGSAALFNFPTDIDTGPDGYIVVADRANNLIRAISPTGVVTTLAGDGSPATLDGRGAAAQINNPIGITVSPNCTIYVQESAGQIRKMTP